MHTLQYNSKVTLGYEYIPLHGSGNVFVGTRYRTKVYLVQGSSRYDLGWVDRKLEEEEIKQEFTDMMGVEQERKYGTQSTLLRSELPNRRDMNRTKRPGIGNG